MKKSKITVSLGILAVVLIGTLSGCSSTKLSSASSSEPKVIYVATQNDYPPFDYVDSSGEIVGYDVDVIKEINKQLPQYKFEFITGPWATVVPSLQANKTQIIADQMCYSEERAETFVFSESYFTTPVFIVVKKGRTDISTLDDLKGKVVEVSNGDTKTTFLEQWNEANGNQLKLKYTENSQPDIYEDIAAGRADATINDKVMTEAIIKNNGVNVQIVGEPFKKSESVFILNKDEQGKEIKAAIDPIIKKFKEDGTLNKIAQKWTGGDYDIK